MKNLIKGVIFDLDGTLIDSNRIWFEVDKSFFRKRGMWLPEGFGEAVGHIGLEAAAIYTKENYFPNESPESIIAEWKSNVLEQYRSVIKLKPHVKEFLEYLKALNIPFCVATANDRECYEECLRRNGIYDYFDFILEVKDYRNKEFPDIYLESAKRLNVKPTECMVFEDLSIALNTAKVAGFKTVAVYDASGKDEEAKKQIADYYIVDYKDMIDNI